MAKISNWKESGFVCVSVPTISKPISVNLGTNLDWKKFIGTLIFRNILKWPCVEFKEFSQSGEERSGEIRREESRVDKTREN